jgi:hypothetical protein
MAATFRPTVNDNITYKMECEDDSNVKVSKEVMIYVAHPRPSVSLDAGGEYNVVKGKKITLI